VGAVRGYRLRQGHHEKRNLWEYPVGEDPESKSGRCVGQVFDTWLAEEIVQAVNAARAEEPCDE
jgi:hypothetical protein